MAAIGKILFISGLLIAVAGLLLLLSDRVGWIGRLPGDITIRRENFTFYLPLATCLIISVILSLLLWILRK
jgi:hypothetical protein